MAGSRKGAKKSGHLVLITFLPLFKLGKVTYLDLNFLVCKMKGSTSTRLKERNTKKVLVTHPCRGGGPPFSHPYVTREESYKKKFLASEDLP